jgi:hypothetical protein
VYGKKREALSPLSSSIENLEKDRKREKERGEEDVRMMSTNTNCRPAYPTIDSFRPSFPD